MKKTAIICEINPYHNGHRHIFECARAEFGGIVIAVMSGNFTQRGIPAVFDKYTRAGVLVTKPNDGGVSAAQYIFMDEAYGEIVIDLYAEGSTSFYVVIQ